jgi:hypothetical protein
MKLVRIVMELVTASASNGRAPYTYAWSTGATGPQDDRS